MVVKQDGLMSSMHGVGHAISPCTAQIWMEGMVTGGKPPAGTLC